MDTSTHTIASLFQQLGLDDSPEGIELFVTNYGPLSIHTPLADAPFWKPSQAAFLREAVIDDADWAEVVDELDARLRH